MLVCIDRTEFLYQWDRDYGIDWSALDIWTSLIESFRRCYTAMAANSFSQSNLSLARPLSTTVPRSTTTNLSQIVRA
jgi:hypothetical protein